MTRLLPRHAPAGAPHTRQVVRHLLDSVGVKGPVTTKEGEVIAVVLVILAVLSVAG